MTTTDKTLSHFFESVDADDSFIPLPREIANSLSNIWNDSLKWYSLTDSINTSYKALETIDRTFDHYFHSSLLSEREAEEKRDEINKQLSALAIKFLQDVNNVHNIPITHVEKTFNLSSLTAHVFKNYFKDADTLALKHLREQARNLLPYKKDCGKALNESLEVTDLVIRKRHLRLRVNWSHDWVDYQCLPYIQALDKLIQALLGKKRPSHVITLTFAQMVDPQEKERSARKYTLTHSYIESFTIYKNGKFLFSF